MAKKFLTQIDMNGLEIQNFLVHNLAAVPTGASGKLYFNTTDNTLYYYNGTAWVALAEGVAVYPATANPVMDGTAAVGTSAKYAREDHVHPSDTNKLNASAVDTSIGSGSTDSTVPSSKCVYDYVGNAIAAVDAMRFKGTIGTGGTVTTLPTSNVKVGDTYRVITAGTYSSIVCEVGDLIIATATTPTWTVAQTNIDGAVTASTTTTNNYLAKFTGNKVVANGPQLGNSTTTYLRNNGTWEEPIKVATGTIVAGNTYCLISMPGTPGSLTGLEYQKIISVNAYIGTLDGIGQYTSASQNAVEIDWTSIISSSNGWTISADLGAAYSQDVAVVVTYRP